MDAIEYVDTMPRAAFHQQILRGVASSGAFSRLATFGADCVSTEEKAGICDGLQAAGVPIRYADTADFDRLLEAVCKAVTSRAVELR